MSRAFVDTSFYVALLNPQDAHHEAASAWSGRPDCSVVVTEFVLLELGNLIARGPKRQVLQELIDSLRADEDTAVIPVSEELFRAGLGLYAARPDKDWSMTDCISFVVMEREGLTDALTADKHFEQAGFKALLR